MDENFIKDCFEIIPEHTQLLNLGKEIFLAGVNWQKLNSWHYADGDYLPEFDREVIVLYDSIDGLKPAISRRVELQDEVKIIYDDHIHIVCPAKYGKGSWDMPNVKWWLDVKTPTELKDK